MLISTLTMINHHNYVKLGIMFIVYALVQSKLTLCRVQPMQQYNILTKIIKFTISNQFKLLPSSSLQLQFQLNWVSLIINSQQPNQTDPTYRKSFFFFSNHWLDLHQIRNISSVGPSQVIYGKIWALVKVGQSDQYVPIDQIISAWSNDQLVYGF